MHSPIIGLSHSLRCSVLLDLFGRLLCSSIEDVCNSVKLFLPCRGSVLPLLHLMNSCLSQILDSLGNGPIFFQIFSPDPLTNSLQLLGQRLLRVDWINSPNLLTVGPRCQLYSRELALNVTIFIPNILVPIKLSLFYVLKF